MFRRLMRGWMPALVLAISLMQGPAAAAAESRKVKNKVEPVYPEIARQMHLAGTVKMQFVITAAGKVKDIRALGGHPLLIEAARAALKEWRYEEGPEKTTVVEFHFAK